MKARFCIAMVTALLLPPVWSTAQVGLVCPAPNCVYWIAQGSGSWEDGVNWSTGEPPGDNDYACITQDGYYTVYLNSSQFVQGLCISSYETQPRLLIQSPSVGGVNSLYIANDSEVGPNALLQVTDNADVESISDARLFNFGGVYLQGGRIGLPFTNGGLLTWSGIAQVVPGFVNLPEGVMEPASDTDNAELQIFGGFSTGGDLYLDGFGSSVTTPLGALTIEEGGRLISSSEPILRGLQVPAEINGSVVNFGEIIVNDVPLQLTGDGVEFRNEANGSIDLLGAGLEVNLAGDLVRAASTFTNLGTISIGAGQTFAAMGVPGLQKRAASTFTNLGTISIGGGATLSMSQGPIRNQRAASTFTNLGTISIGGGALLRVDGSGFEGGDGSAIEGDGEIDMSNASSATNDGALRPGFSPGALLCTGSLNQFSGARLEIEIGGTTPGTGFDVWTVTGTYERAGGLGFSVIGGHQPEVGNRYDFAFWGEAIGNYDMVSLPEAVNDVAWELDTTVPDGWSLVAVCGGPDLGLAAAADKDPVSVDRELTFELVVSNPSQIAAPDVQVMAVLDPGLVFEGSDPLGLCTIVPNGAVCELGTVAGMSSMSVPLPVRVVLPGQLTNEFVVESSWCDPDVDDNISVVVANAVTAAPCNADGDALDTIDEWDLPAAVQHIFGLPAPGNPDCTDDGAVDAADLAAILVEIF